MLVKAFGKINLTLEILNRKSDGYHNLRTLIAPLSIHDTIEIKVLKNSTESFVTCDALELHGDRFNLVSMAIDLLREKYNFKEQFRITIYKRLFISAGLGGGSSDAAAVILGIVKLLKLPATKQELVKIAKKIGSDVPFFLENKMALCEGIGDKITLIEKYSKYYVLLIKPHEGLSTKEVYQKYDELHELEKSDGEEKEKRKRIDYQKLMKLYDNGKFKEFKKEAVNDLYKPAKKLLPVIEKIKHILIADYGFSLVGMTGSGSCLYVVSKNKRELYKFMKENFERYQIELTKIM